MLYHAVTLFAITIFASLVGFGGVLPTAVAVTKAWAVLCLLAFFVTLFRLLYDES
jgi:uncharacterized membrane protein YtjA (UPF0391 family)